MEISGHDSVVFTTADPRVVCVEFFQSLHDRWPNYLADVEPDLGQLPPGTLLEADQLPKESCEIYVLRDDEMGLFADGKGYGSMPDGDGPFMMIYQFRTDINYQLGLVSEPQTPGEIQGPSPYNALLSCPWIVAFTLVTPSDPTTDGFSNWLLSLLRNACSNTQLRTSNAP